MTPLSDIVIVGGGIVGLATALQLLERWPGLRVTLLEKEADLARHQTGHNSGVIHSGIYYRPGSLKAALCVEGARLLIDFCRRHSIPHAVRGKIVVATSDTELPALRRLYEQGRANGVEGLSTLGPEQLREIEPEAQGVQALHVPTTGTVEYPAVAAAYARIVRERGGTVRCSAEVSRLARQGGEWIVQTTSGEFRSRYLVTCAGLQADRVARRAGAQVSIRIVPFRGDYYELAPARRDLVRSMIYPVPNSAFPFLGVHFTRGLDGSVHVGPNAVLALKREGYRRGDIAWPDVVELAGFVGFWKMLHRYRALGLQEIVRTWSKSAFVAAAQRLLPDVQAKDLVPGGSGVRAQAVDAAGQLLNDFEILTAENAIHVCNVPSPAATASLSIGQRIATLASEAFNLRPPAERLTSNIKK
ncbi:MAG: L-2-hydroxyglutarate oxidase [Candidatus Omnitrophica bacterium CG11_big_fil_rev_8_21_14_0_20_63_9]|nr:MAG: L-2-hydroxyglutarate oxidase [Candidatus Omnitrophica bacterium CG11_big_fil_rev_8_21_14_0_20_63_9]